MNPMLVQIVLHHTITYRKIYMMDGFMLFKGQRYLLFHKENISFKIMKNKTNKTQNQIVMLVQIFAGCILLCPKLNT